MLHKNNTWKMLKNKNSVFSKRNYEKTSFCLEMMIIEHAHIKLIKKIISKILKYSKRCVAKLKRNQISYM